MSRNIKSSKELRQLNAYSLVKEESIEEIKSHGLLFEHRKTGARVVVLSNEDDNKVFSIGFRTPPANSTGVAHIVEHTVLCGSRKYPSKDPFIELAKGSLNTFLNAMTFPDKTVYPIASCNEKDFQNLMNVYMDAVFYPNIYKKEEIFWQEGWHYEIEKEEDPITYNGVVYNEMKGAFSSPDQISNRLIQQALFPDTAYGTESGGDPDFIPDLSYEEFLAFHSKYYHPSNSYIYLYGDLDIEEKLEWIDKEYLNDFERAVIDSEIRTQKAFDTMKEVTKDYPVAADESTENKTYLSYNTVIGTSLDKELYLAFQIIEHVLAGTQGAPLKQALLDAGIGKDILSSYDNGLKQTVFTIMAKNSDADKKDDFIRVIEEVLNRIVREGFDEKALQAAINVFEFRYREADFGTYPKGLMYGLQILDTWLYDDSLPFIHIKANKTFEELRAKIGTGYYEGLIQTYMLNNTHKAVITVKPSAGLSQIHEQQILKKLADYKSSLTKQEIQQLVEETARLNKFQEEPSTKEELEAIPLLTRDDIKKKTDKLYNDEYSAEGIKVLHHNVYTNGIGYLKLLFDISQVPYEKISYVGLLSNILGKMDTEKHTYPELSKEININTGSVVVDTNVYGRKARPDVFQPKLEVRMKALFGKYQPAVALVEEIMFDTIFDDEKRLLELISEFKTRMEAKMSSSGHLSTINRSFTYHSSNAAYESLLSGLDYYYFIASLEREFDSRKDELIRSLKELTMQIFCKNNLLVSVTGDQEGYGTCITTVSPLLRRLPLLEKSEETPHIPVKQRNEGLKYSGKVQYVARTGNFIDAGYEYRGALKVLKVILSYDYLWQNVRVKGGAYGCMCGFTQEGIAYFASYRDPNLRETNEVYKNVVNYLADFSVDERDMTKYIIGAISNLDTPRTPNGHGVRSLNAYLGGFTEEDFQRDRDEVLAADVESIRACAKICEAFLAEGNICVIGSEDKIEECRDMFGEVKSLII